MLHEETIMLKKVEKNIYYNNETGHYQLRFIFRNMKTGVKSRPNIVAKIKLEDGTIRHAENKDEARLAMSQYISNGGPIDNVILKKDTALFSSCIKSYIEYCDTLGKKRSDLIETYCNCFLCFLAELYFKGNVDKASNKIRVSEIQTNDFIKYMSKRQKDKVVYKTKHGEKWTGRYVSNATINREMNSIKGLFSYMKKVINVIETNPCDSLGKPLRVVKKPKEPLTLQQESIIFTEAKEDYCLYVMILLSDILGTRRGEILNLKWKNLHFESNKLYKYGYVDFIDRKNGKNLRLPLSKELKEALVLLPKNSEYVFTNPKTGTKYVNRYKKLNKVLVKAGVKTRGIGWHIFRHNTSNNMEQNGAEASTIKDVLGNTTTVVESNYLNQGIKRKQEVIDINSERIRKIIKKHEKIKSVQEVSKIIDNVAMLKQQKS